MSTPNPAAPRPGDRFVHRRGIASDYQHYAVVTVSAVRRRNSRTLVYYAGDGAGRCVAELGEFPALVRDPAGPDGDPDNPPTREPRSTPR